MVASGLRRLFRGVRAGDRYYLLLAQGLVFPILIFLTYTLAKLLRNLPLSGQEE